jgi:L-lactate dehydrogenase
VLDTTRFRSLLADKFGVAATDVEAVIVGEHGDSMVPVWSTINVAGASLSSVPGYDQDAAKAVFERARTSGAEVIRLKGGAGSAVGVSIREVVHTILLDTGSILPVSSLQTGSNGVCGVALSVPTRVGRAGVLGHVEIALSPEEKAGLLNSAEVLKKTLSQVG